MLLAFPFREAVHHGTAPEQGNGQRNERIDNLSSHAKKDIRQRPRHADSDKSPNNEAAFHVQDELLEDLIFVVRQGELSYNGAVGDRHKSAEKAENDNGHCRSEEGPQHAEHDNVSLGLGYDVVPPDCDNQKVRPQSAKLDKEADQQTENQGAEFETAKEGAVRVRSSDLVIAIVLEQRLLGVEQYGVKDGLTSGGGRHGSC